MESVSTSYHLSRKMRDVPWPHYPMAFPHFPVKGENISLLIIFSPACKAPAALIHFIKMLHTTIFTKNNVPGDYGEIRNPPFG